MATEADNLPAVTESHELVQGSQDYKMVRAQIAEVCEKLASSGSPRHTALSFVERWENSIWASVLAAAPDAKTAKQWFEVAARSFLDGRKEG